MMHDWQPIETAPQGQRVLVTDGEAVWVSWKDGNVWWTSDVAGGEKTHWVSFPEPPSALEYEPEQATTYGEMSF